MGPPLIGSIVERKPTTTPIFKQKNQSNSDTGFPIAQHRSKSAFAKAREASRGSATSTHVPVVQHGNQSSVSQAPSTQSVDSTMERVNTSTGEWQTQMSRENEERVENMSVEEREEARTEILERFGPDILDLIRRKKQRRGKDPLHIIPRHLLKLRCRDVLSGPRWTGEFHTIWYALNSGLRVRDSELRTNAPHRNQGRWQCHQPNRKSSHRNITSTRKDPNTSTNWR